MSKASRARKAAKHNAHLAPGDAPEDIEETSPETLLGQDDDTEQLEVVPELTE